MRVAWTAERSVDLTAEHWAAAWAGRMVVMWVAPTAVRSAGHWVASWVAWRAAESAGWRAEHWAG